MLTGAILAGGQNRRMNGQVKALLPFNGELMIQRQISLMQRICNEIIVATHDPALFLPILDRSVHIVMDMTVGIGPLSGMHSALSLSSNAAVWIVACDMPFISADAARLMLAIKQDSGSDAIIPEVGGRTHPLHGIYDKCVAEVIPPLLGRKQYRVQGMLELIQCQSVPESYFAQAGVDLRFVTNMNTPEEYAAAQDITKVR